MGSSRIDPDGIVIGSGTSDPATPTEGKLFYNNDGVGALRVGDGSAWKNVYEAPRTGASAALAITEVGDVDNIAVNGAYYFNVGGSTFQTYVDVNLDGKGKWALIRKMGATTTGDQTYNSGYFDLFDLDAHGTMTNTSFSTASKDTLSRDQINGLFRLNPNAGIMGMYFYQNGCSAGTGTPNYYYVKKVTNRTTFDAWYGIWNEGLWSDQSETYATTGTLTGAGTAWKVTIGSNNTWTSDNTDFDHNSNYAFKNWDVWQKPAPIGWNDSTFYVGRHGPIYTDWTGGCQWLYNLRDMSSYTASGLLWVKL